VAAEEPPPPVEQPPPAPSGWPTSAAEAQALAPVSYVATERSGTDDTAVEDFVAPLANYGAWVDVAPYGRVWQPADEVAGEEFTPYASDGAWVTGDDGSWAFRSKYDDQWGWATYHYGRWVDHEAYGWLWVPGTIWAPSWVEWRYGGGYVGWVPMAPPGMVVDENRWVFVEQRHFAENGVFAYRLPPERLHLAFVTAAPIVEVREGANWTVGPSPALLRAAGVPVRAERVAPPGPGYVRARAGASLRAAGAQAGRSFAAPTLRRGPSAVHAPRRPAPAERPVVAPPARSASPPAARPSPRARPPARHRKW